MTDPSSSTEVLLWKVYGSLPLILAIRGAKIANRIRNTMKPRLAMATLLRRIRRQASAHRDRPSTAAGASVMPTSAWATA